MEYLITDKHSWSEAAAWSLNANALAAVAESQMKWEGCSAGKRQQQSLKAEKTPQISCMSHHHESVHRGNTSQHPLALLHQQAKWQQPERKRHTVKAKTISWRGRWLRCDTEHMMFIPPTFQGHVIFVL